MGGAVLLLMAASTWMQTPSAQRGQRGWPPIAAETKPWTRWWWQGSAVESKSITAQLEALAAAGIGGVEVTPIYGVRGAEDRFISYLSPQWMAMLDHTLREAARLKMGVDMATGTGWPFGGPWVDDDATPRSIVYKTWTLSGGERLTEPVSAAAGTARARHRQPDSHRQRRRAWRSAARRGAAPVIKPEARAIQDHRSCRARHRQPESAGAGSRAGEVSARLAARAC